MMVVAKMNGRLVQVLKVAETVVEQRHRTRCRLGYSRSRPTLAPNDPRRQTPSLRSESFSIH